MDRAKIGRASKARAKTYERDVAKALGGTRYPADTGGPLDVLVPGFAGVQVKSGGNVVTEVIRQGMAEAVVGCQGTALTPLLAVVDNRGARNQTYIILRLADWIDLHGTAHPPVVHTPPPCDHRLVLKAEDGVSCLMCRIDLTYDEAIGKYVRSPAQTLAALREAGIEAPPEQVVDTSAKVDV